MAKQFDEVRVPFTKMTFTPDVPSTALQPNEYNSGLNVETDVRGIRSVNGDEPILKTVPGTSTFVSGGYRRNGEFWFIVATVEGRWWATNGNTVDWYDITPNGVPFTGYTQATNIMDSWNGNVVFFNDSLNPPMFLPDEPGAVLVQYSNQVPISIDNLTANVVALTNTITFSGPFTTTGSSISGTTLTIGTLVSGTIDVNMYLSGGSVAAGTKIINNISGTGSGSTWTVDISQSLGATDLNGTIWENPPFAVGSYVIVNDVDPAYYNGTYVVTACDYLSVTYTSSQQYTYAGGGTVAPKYTWNYNPTWKSVYANFMRVYSTPNVGCILVAGNLTATLVDDTVVNYPTTVQWSQSFGLNQAPTTWVPTVTNVANQLEVPLRGPALDCFPSNGQLFLCSYWDTVVFAPINYATTNTPILGVRLFNQGRGLLSSNCWGNTDKLVYGVDARDIWVFDGSDFKGLGNQRVKNWFFDQLDPANWDRVFMEVNSEKNQIEIYYPTTAATNGVPNKMLAYRYDLDVFQAPRDVASATMGCESPIWTNTGNISVPAWEFSPASRTIVYARGVANVSLAQKDIGNTFIANVSNAVAISSSFRRDNIKMLANYSGKLLVHRILPEVVSLDSHSIEMTPGVGNITITLEGSNSVGSRPDSVVGIDVPIDASGNTANPWAQFDQNAYRVNTIELTNTSSAAPWMCSATTWQYTQTEDDR